MANANGNGNTAKTEAVLKEVEDFGYAYGKGQTAKGDVYEGIFTKTLSGGLKWVEVEKGANAAKNKKTDLGMAANRFLAGEKSATGSISQAGRNITSQFQKIAEYATKGNAPAATWKEAQRRRNELSGQGKKVQDLAKVLVNISRAALKGGKNATGVIDDMDSCILVKSSTKTLARMLSGEKSGVIAIAEIEASADIPTNEAEAIATLIQAARDYLAVRDENTTTGGVKMTPDEQMETFVKMGIFKRLANGTYKPVAAK